MQTLHLKPADGRTVLNPDSSNRPLAAGGEIVPASMYWQHRLRDGAVVEVPAAKPSTKVK